MSRRPGNTRPPVLSGVEEVLDRFGRCAATTTMAGRAASSKDVPEASIVASSEWFP